MKYLCHKFVLLLTVTLILPFWGVGGSTVLAQGQDPTLAAMILLYTKKAKRMASIAAVSAVPLVRAIMPQIRRPVMMVNKMARRQTSIVAAMPA